MVYERTVVYRICAETLEDAVAKWAEDGPKVWEGGDVVIQHFSHWEELDELLPRSLAEGEGEDE
jgi:hypothetical protein